MTEIVAQVKEEIVIHCSKYELILMCRVSSEVEE